MLGVWVCAEVKLASPGDLWHLPQLVWVFKVPSAMYAALFQLGLIPEPVLAGSSVPPVPAGLWQYVLVQVVPTYVAVISPPLVASPWKAGIDEPLA